MFICQAFCILQPPATVALTWHHLGSWDSSIYLHSSSPYLLTFICHRTHSRPVKGAIWEQKLCLHHCTNRLSLIKLSCFSDFADGYFHCEPHLVMKFVVRRNVTHSFTQKHTHKHTNTINQFPSWWNKQYPAFKNGVLLSELLIGPLRVGEFG